MRLLPPRGTNDFLWAFVGRGGAAFLQALSVVLLARFSNPSDFGLAMGVQGALLTVAFFLGFGFGPYMTVQRARSPLSEEVARVAYCNQRTSLGAGIVCAVLLSVASGVEARVLWLLPLCIAMAAHRNSAVWEGIVLADGRIKLFALTLVTRRLILVSLMVGVMTIGAHPLLAFSVAYALSEVVVNLIFRRTVGRIRRPAASVRFREVIKQSSPYWIEAVSVQFRGLDVSASGLAAGPIVSGLYAVPARLSSAILMLPSTFANLSLPRIVKGPPRTFVRIGVFSLPVMLLVFALIGLLALFAEPIIRIVLGEAYMQAVLPTQIFCIGFAALSVVTIVNAMFQGIGLTREVAFSSVLGSILMVVFVGVGAAWFGAPGSSWGYSVAVVVQLVTVCCICARPVSKYLRS